MDIYGYLWILEICRYLWISMDSENISHWCCIHFCYSNFIKFAGFVRLLDFNQRARNLASTKSDLFSWHKCDANISSNLSEDQGTSSFKYSFVDGPRPMWFSFWVLQGGVQLSQNIQSMNSTQWCKHHVTWLQRSGPVLNHTNTLLPAQFNAIFTGPFVTAWTVVWALVAGHTTLCGVVVGVGFLFPKMSWMRATRLSNT